MSCKDSYSQTRAKLLALLRAKVDLSISDLDELGAHLEFGSRKFIETGVKEFTAIWLT